MLSENGFLFELLIISIGNLLMIPLHNFKIRGTSFSKIKSNFCRPHAVSVFKIQKINDYGTFIFVAFCSFFSCSLTVVHRGRQQKSGGPVTYTVSLLSISVYYLHSRFPTKNREWLFLTEKNSSQIFWKKNHFFLKQLFSADGTM